ncbi:MAG: hypothetical protein ACK4G3_00260, partial [bacterium]
IRLWILMALFGFILHSCDRFLLLQTQPVSPSEKLHAVLILPRFLTFFSLLYFFGIFLAVGIGAFQIENEIRRKFLLNFLSRNVNRTMYLSSRVLAACFLFLTFSLTSLALFHLMYSEYHLARDWRLYRIYLYLFLLQFMIYALSQFLSGIFSPILSAGLTLFLLFLPGLLRFLWSTTEEKWLATVWRVLYWLLPAFDRVNLVEMGFYLAQEKQMKFLFRRAPGDVSLSLHLFLYALLLLWFYSRRFQKRALSGG